METPEHSPAGPAIPDTFVPIEIPVPPNAAETFGYPGSSRHVAFYWEPVGDELCYDDGRTAGTGSWYPFLQYRSHRHVAPKLRRWNLGYSDEEADHWLVLDTRSSRAWIARSANARTFLREQHPPQPPLRMVDLARIREEIRIAVSRQSDTVEQMRELQHRQQHRLRELLSFCDSWRPR